MGLDSLVGDSALGSSYGLGDGGRSMDGWGSNAMSNTSTISTIASLRGAIGDGGSQTGVSNKLGARNIESYRCIATCVHHSVIAHTHVFI